MSCQDIFITINSDPDINVTINDSEDINITLQGAAEYTANTVFNGAIYTVSNPLQLEYFTYGNAVVKPNSLILFLNGIFMTEGEDYHLSTNSNGVVFDITLKIEDQVVLHYAEI